MTAKVEGRCIDHGLGYAPRGYVHRWVVTEAGKKKVLNHRIVFEMFYGYRPEVVMHLCDNPRCINIQHLEAGTYALNNKDRARKGRSAKTRPDRRTLTDDQVREIRAMYIPGSRRGSPHGVMAVVRRFGIDSNTVYQIHSRRTYKDVA